MFLVIHSSNSLMFRRKSLGCRPTPVDPAKVASQAFRTPLQVEERLQENGRNLREVKYERGVRGSEMYAVHRNWDPDINSCPGPGPYISGEDLGNACQ